MQMQPPRPAAQPPNPSLAELKAIRKEMSDLATELAGLRKDLKDKKTFAITDSVAKGMVIGSLFMAGCLFVLALLVPTLFM